MAKASYCAPGPRAQQTSERLWGRENLVRITLVDSADFIYFADLEPVSTPRGHFALRIASRWRRAKNPEAEQKKFEMLLDQEGLIGLRDLLDRNLTLTGEASS
jgi:hypothetical protein